MGKYKFSVFLLVIIMLFCIIAGCGKANDEQQPDGESETTTQSLDGTWVNNKGDVLKLDFAQESFTFARFDGRYGSGYYSYDNGQNMIDFDGFLYELVIDGDVLTLQKNARVPMRKHLKAHLQGIKRL